MATSSNMFWHTILSMIFADFKLQSSAWEAWEDEMIPLLQI